MRNLRPRDLILAAGAVCLFAVLAYAGASGAGEKAAGWALNATAIVSCSCSMFCTCYFDTKPAGHHGYGGATEHYCKFNMAYKVNSGHHGKVDLAGARFWIAGDLGNEFGDGEADWAVVTVDPSVTPEQRGGIAAALPHVFPIRWKSFTIGEDAAIAWEATQERAAGRLDGGKGGEIVLTNNVLRNAEAPVVIGNLKYWGVPRNDGFVLMPNEVNAYRRRPNAFETKGTNGFMITIDMNSSDLPAPEAAPAAAE